MGVADDGRGSRRDGQEAAGAAESPARSDTRDVVWGYLAQALNAGSALLILPALLVFLDSDRVGLWFVFVTLSGLAQLMELGFQPTIARNMAYILAGQRDLQASGLSTAAPEAVAGADPVLLATLVQASRWIFRSVALLGALVLLVPGSLYITTLLSADDLVGEVLLAWGLFATGSIVTFYFGYLTALLQGRGDVTAANQVVVVTRASLVLGAWLLVPFFGLLGAGLANLAACVLGRLAALRSLAQRPLPLAPEEAGVARIREMARLLWHNSSRQGLVQLGTFLVQRANVLVASSVLGLTAAASYGLTASMLIALANMAMAVCTLNLPYMHVLQTRGDRAELSRVYGEVLALGLGSFALGLTALIVLGPLLLELVGSSTEMLPPLLATAFGVVVLLEVHHSMAGAYLTTQNRVPFFAAAILSGIASISLSLLAVVPFGVTGLVAAQGLAQAAYNNWKWPMVALTDLGVSFPEILRRGVRSALRLLPGGDRARALPVEEGRP